MQFTEDLGFMELAMEQARISSSEGNFPVGAVLVIDGKLIDTSRNLITSNSDWISHAEMGLLTKHAPLIKKSRKNNLDVVIYSTFEPCLMCHGTCVLNRISRIVYACPDPFTGATHIGPNLLPVGYASMCPKIESGLLKNESKKLLIEHMNKHNPEKWKLAISLLMQLK